MSEQQILETRPSTLLPVIRALGRLLTLSAPLLAPITIDHYNLATNIVDVRTAIPLTAVLIVTTVCSIYNASLSIVTRESGRNISEFVIHSATLPLIGVALYLVNLSVCGNLDGINLIK